MIRWLKNLFHRETVTLEDRLKKSGYDTNGDLDLQRLS